MREREKIESSMEFQNLIIFGIYDCFRLELTLLHNIDTKTKGILHCLKLCRNPFNKKAKILTF